MFNKNSIVYLSYSLSNSTPLYGNGTGIKFAPDKEMSKGNSCNTMNLSFPNHCGTHIDFPYHFNPQGKTINDFSADFWQFNHVDMVDFSGKVGDCQIINPELFHCCENKETDLLIIKTGYGLYRSTDRYTLTPPGLSADLAPFFRKNFPKLRCIGIDLISISSYSNREEGRRAHNAFLNSDEGDPILLIEDMKLDMKGPFERVVVAPLFIDNIDGAPCTIFAYTNN